MHAKAPPDLAIMCSLGINTVHTGGGLLKHPPLLAEQIGTSDVAVQHIDRLVPRYLDHLEH
jgi:hypothetical protein